VIRQYNDKSPSHKNVMLNGVEESPCGYKKTDLRKDRLKGNLLRET